MAALGLAVTSIACVDQKHCPHNTRVCIIPGADVPHADADATASETVDDTVAETEVADTTDHETTLPDTADHETEVADTTGDTVTACDAGSYDAGDHCQPCTAVSECIGVLTCTSAGDSHCSLCATGYEQLAAGAACSDIDECESENGGCDAHATCANIDGGRTCDCKPHFSGDGLTCEPAMCNDPPNGATILEGYVDGGAFTVGAVPRATAVGDIDGDGIPTSSATATPRPAPAPSACASATARAASAAAPTSTPWQGRLRPGAGRRQPGRQAGRRGLELR
ncbi:MAG: calcium-binding EGF-like domain-containing protein [Myxococcota bacterium]